MERHAALVQAEPVRDADEILPPEKTALGMPGGQQHTFWEFEGAELSRIVEQGFVYLVVWRGDDLVQPMRMEVPLTAN